MAKGDMMLQIAVEQILSPEVLYAPEIWAVALDSDAVSAPQPEERSMEISIVGEGEVVIRFIDQRGRTLAQEKLVVSGSPTVEAKRTIALRVETPSGGVWLSPVLVRQSNPRRRVVRQTGADEGS